MSFLEVSDFSVFQKHKKIVDNVSFSLEKGELVALIGLNGSGKTTLMRGICRLVPSLGSCAIDGQAVARLSRREIARLIAYIPQRSGINFSLSVIDLVLMGFAPSMSIFENYSSAQQDLALSALESVGMLERADDDFLRLSEGEKQLCVLARATVQDCPLMLFDEPDSALDFCNRHLILGKMREIIAQNRLGILCLHDASFALNYCDRALLLRDGKLVFELDIRSASLAEIERALGLIYGDVRVISVDGQYMLLTGGAL